MSRRERLVPPLGSNTPPEIDRMSAGLSRPLDLFIFTGGANSSDRKVISVSGPSLIKFGRLRGVSLVLGPTAIANLSGWNLQIDAYPGMPVNNPLSLAFEDRQVLQAQRGWLFLPFAGSWTINIVLYAANIAVAGAAAQLGGMIYENIPEAMAMGLMNAPQSHSLSGLQTLAAGDGYIPTTEVGLCSAVISSSGASMIYGWGNPFSGAPVFTCPTAGTNTAPHYIGRDFFGSNNLYFWNSSAGALNLSTQLGFD